MEYQSVVNQSSRNPTEPFQDEPFNQLSNRLTVSYDVHFLNHGRPEDTLRCWLPTKGRGMLNKNGDSQVSVNFRPEGAESNLFRAFDKFI